MKIQYLGPVILATIVAVFVAVSFSSTSDTSAFSGYLTAFNTKYGTDGTKLDDCATCHNEDFSLNDYGAAIEAQGGAIDAALAAVESLDSDGDTYSNIDEITARTWPGDATDFPGGGPTPTPPLPTPTPEPTPTPPPPTPTPAGPELIQGDVDCNGTVNSVDALKVLRFVAGLSVAQEPDCPDINTEVASLFGDVDCSTAVNSVDSLKILRFVAGMSVTQTEPCADIGDPLN
jgi:hypothetical protein